ncbi:hypothetical protein HQ520_14555 [bacterium]|nr:hypothetical protein [bacterium]
MIRILIVNNILNRLDREILDVPFTGGMLSDYIPERCQKDHRCHLMTIGPVAREKWAETPVEAREEIVLLPDVQAAAGLIAGIIVGGILWAGWKAITPKLPLFNVGDLSSSPTYGWDGIQSTAEAGVPVGAIYGTHRVGGNYINVYSTTENDSDTLYALLAISEGPIYSIAGIAADTDSYSDLATIGDKIQINGNPISNLTGVEVCVRLGGDQQTRIPWFANANNQVAYGQQLLKDAVHTLTTTEGEEVDAVDVNFEIQGLYKTENGKYKSKWATFRIMYKEHSEPTTWTELFFPLMDDGTDNPDPNDYKTYIGKTSSTLRRTVRIEFPTPGRYDVRIIKTTRDTEAADEVVSNTLWESLNEIQYDTYTYPNTALLGLKIVATDQISGGLPEIKVDVLGIRVKAPDYEGASGDDVNWVNTYWNDDNSEYRMVDDDTSLAWDGATLRRQYCANPIWCLYDLLTNRRYGLGDQIETASLNFSLFASMAAHCDEYVQTSIDDETLERRYELGLVMDSAEKALDMVLLVCKTCQCFPYWTAGAIQPRIDKLETPTQMFGMGNIIPGSFQEAWASKRAAYNSIEIQYFDAALSFERTSAQVVDSDAYDAGEPIRNSLIFLPGVTKQSRAIRIANRLLNEMKYNYRSIGFKTGPDAVACTVSDVINVSHDVPIWGLVSGRVASGGAASVVLDAEVVLQPASTYYIRVRHMDDSLELRQISNPAGTYAAGETITVSAAWDTAPQAYEIFTLGQQNLECKPFRVMRLTQNDNLEVEISATEYNEEIYSDTGIVIAPPDRSNLPDPNAPPADVTNLRAANSSAAYDYTVYLTFDIPSTSPETGFWDHAEVYISDDGESYALHGVTRAGQYEIRNLLAGETYYFKVRSVSKWQIRSAWATAPEVSLTVGTESRPPQVEGLELDNQGNDAEFDRQNPTFAWKEKTLVFDDVGMGNEPFGFGGGSRPPYFKDYLIEILVAGQVVRTETTIEPRYTYTFEKNVQDNVSAARDLTVKVWERDILNRRSLYPAVLDVTNPNPAEPENFAAAVSGDRVSFSWDEVDAVDLAGYEMRYATSPAAAWGDMQRIFIGLGAQYSWVDPLAPRTIYVSLASFDTYRKGDLNRTDDLTVTTTT